MSCPVLPVNIEIMPLSRSTVNTLTIVFQEKTPLRYNKEMLFVAKNAIEQVSDEYARVHIGNISSSNTESLRDARDIAASRLGYIQVEPRGIILFLPKSYESSFSNKVVHQLIVDTEDGEVDLGRIRAVSYILPGQNKDLLQVFKKFLLNFKAVVAKEKAEIVSRLSAVKV